MSAVLFVCVVALVVDVVVFVVVVVVVVVVFIFVASVFAVVPLSLCTAMVCQCWPDSGSASLFMQLRT